MRRIPLISAVFAIAIAASTTLAGEGHKNAALHGYCPVAYIAAGKAIKGNPELSMDFAGKHYVFANADAKKMFQADPAKFHVAYDGYCATAVSMGKKVESDPTVFEVVNGTTYLFSSADAKKAFDKDTAGVIAKADEKWAALEPAFGGYCPVAYAMMQKAIKGDPEQTLVYDGHRYNFANADAKKMFEKDPSKFTVAYDGYCATAMSMGKRLESDPTIFAVKDGVTYLFSSAKAQEMFDAKPDEVVTKADQHWASHSSN
jgi:YHS domain-containing protein